MAIPTDDDVRQKYNAFEERFLKLITLDKEEDQEALNILIADIEKAVDDYKKQMPPTPLIKTLFLNPYSSFTNNVLFKESSILKWKEFFRTWHDQKYQTPDALYAYYANYEFPAIAQHIYAQLIAKEVNTFKATYKKTEDITETEYTACDAAYKKITTSPGWKYGHKYAEDLTAVCERYKKGSNATLEKARKIYDDLLSKFFNFFKSGTTVSLDDIQEYRKEVDAAYALYASRKTTDPSAEALFSEKKFQTIPGSLFSFSQTHSLQTMVDSTLGQLKLKIIALGKGEKITWSPSELLATYLNASYKELHTHVLKNEILAFETNFGTDNPFAEELECQKTFDRIKEVPMDEIQKLDQDIIKRYCNLNAIREKNTETCHAKSKTQLKTAEKERDALLKEFLGFFIKDKEVAKADLRAHKKKVKETISRYKKDPQASACFTNITKYCPSTTMLGSASEVETTCSLREMVKNIIDPLLKSDQETITWDTEQLMKYRQSPYYPLRCHILSTVALRELDDRIAEAKKNILDKKVTFSQKQEYQSALGGYFSDTEDKLLNKYLPVNYAQTRTQVASVLANSEKVYRTCSQKAIQDAQHAFDFLFKEFADLMVLTPIDDENIIKFHERVQAEMERCLLPEYPETDGIFALWKNLKGITGEIGITDAAAGLTSKLEAYCELGGQTLGISPEKLVSVIQGSGTGTFIQGTLNSAAEVASSLLGTANRALINRAGIDVNDLVSYRDPFQSATRQALNEWTALIRSTSLPKTIQEKIAYYKRLCDHYDRKVPWTKVQTHLQYIIQGAMLQDFKSDQLEWHKNFSSLLKEALERKETHAVWLDQCINNTQKIQEEIDNYHSLLSQNSISSGLKKELGAKILIEEVAPPEEPPPMPAHLPPEPNTEEEKPVNDPVTEAVKTALSNYQHWFKQHRSPKFFAKKMDDTQVGRKDSYGTLSWTRHHKSGQEKAAGLLQGIEKLDKASATEKVNAFLIDSKTRYHLHSFASFLLDELAKIDSSPWQKIAVSKSKHYDKAKVEQIINKVR